MSDEKPKEVVKRNFKSKTVYHFVDPIAGFEVKSREEFKNKQCIVHFPFNTKSGKKKYDGVKEIVFENEPPIPAGFLKTSSTGYGFTRELSPLLWPLQKAYPKLERIVVSDTKATQVNGGKEIVLNTSFVKAARSRIVSVQERHRGEVADLANNILAPKFSKFTKRKSDYGKGQLREFVTGHSLKTNLLSDDDIRSIIDIVALIPASHELVKTGELLSTKESFDRVLIEDIIAKYNKLLSLKSDRKNKDDKGLEDRWQDFFSDNILFFDFGYVERFEKERISGDKTLNIPDFILLNTFGYLDVFEIKTHLTQLLSYDKGRKNFFWASEAAKAISQAENYIDSLVSQEDTVIKNIRDEYDIHNVDAIRPQVYVIAGTREAIAGEKTGEYKGKVKKKLWNDFRRLNHSLKNIEFVLYDELLEVFENMLNRLATDD